MKIIMGELKSHRIYDCHQFVSAQQHHLHLRKISSQKKIDESLNKTAQSFEADRGKMRCWKMLLILYDFATGQSNKQWHKYRFRKCCLLFVLSSIVIHYEIVPSQKKKCEPV